MYQLDPSEISFPNPMEYHPLNGLLACGGDLSVERLLFSYQNGIFPWYNPGEEILWWCPDPRFVMRPNHLKISKSMRKIINSQAFDYKENTAFEKVIRHCMETKRQEQDASWISDELINSFLRLHEMGLAYSAETWQAGELVGGLYGLWVGQVFCGESMFSRVSNASKYAFIQFVNHNKHRIQLIDCQVYSEHLESLGAVEIPKQDFLKIIYAQAH